MRVAVRYTSVQLPLHAEGLNERQSEWGLHLAAATLTLWLFSKTTFTLSVTPVVRHRMSVLAPFESLTLSFLCRSNGMISSHCCHRPCASTIFESQKE